MAERAEDEARRVNRALGRWFKGSGLAIREAERRMGWGQGTLNSVLSGSVSLRFDHVASILEVCELDLREFYMTLATEGYGRKSDEPPERARRPKKRISPEVLDAIRKETKRLLKEMLESGGAPEKGENDEG